jgi:ABC-type transport system involved in Fe-S cluster assembly fused permease/ATPase subunit
LVVIAHRLHTVIDFDQIVVLGDGLVLQAGKPSVLLDESGPLLDMATALGSDTTAKLKELAARE